MSDILRDLKKFIYFYRFDIYYGLFNFELCITSQTLYYQAIEERILFFNFIGIIQIGASGFFFFFLFNYLVCGTIAMCLVGIGVSF